MGAYHVLSETVADNAAHASVVHVDVHIADRRPRLSVREDGVGGAEPGRGSGLVGLADHVQVLGGTLSGDQPGRIGHRIAGLPPRRRPVTADR